MTRARIQMNLSSSMNLLFPLFRQAQCGTQEEKKKGKESKRTDKSLLKSGQSTTKLRNLKF